MKSVGIYIASFNSEKTISFCLEAVLRQTYPIKSIVVIDDASTDDTPKIISKYPAMIIRHESNKGLAVSRNTAITNIKEEFIASIDADCQPTQDWLKHLMKRFNSEKIAGVGGKLIEGYHSTVFDYWRSVHMKQHPEEGVLDFICGSNAVFRKDALIEIGTYDASLGNNYEDVDICNRLKNKGYHLAYEPKAIIYHLKSDDICSVLNTYWEWNSNYYKKTQCYSNPNNFNLKIKDNIGLMNRYIEDDIDSGKLQLIYLDFLLSFHHSYKDLLYYTHLRTQEKITIRNKLNNNALKGSDELLSDCRISGDIAEKNNLAGRIIKDYSYSGSAISYWVALLDLIFFYRLESTHKKISTLISAEECLLQNFFALSLILGESIRKKFTNPYFIKIFYKHLFLITFKIKDEYLIERLLTLVELRSDWSVLVEKKQPNLNNLFLKTMYISMGKWLDNAESNFHNIFTIIEISALRIDKNGGL